MSGAQIRRARTDAGMTQQDLAMASGVAQPNIAAYESGRRRPSRQMLKRLLEAARPRPSIALSERREAVLATAHRHRASDVRVFGSIARGTDNANSDIDLLVTFDADASLFDLLRLAEELELLLGRRVDVVSERGLRPGRDPIRDEAVAL